MWPITGSMADRRLSCRLMAPNTPRFCPEMKTLRGFVASWPRYPFIDKGALDLAAGELLCILHDSLKRVAVIGIAGQRFGVQHELTAGGAGVGADDRDLDAVGCACLALADALDRGSVEVIELPAALAQTLGANLVGPPEWRGGEYRLEIFFAFDLAADVTHQPAQPRA